ncbi:MAG: cysteine synthase A [Bacillota bacterium]
MVYKSILDLIGKTPIVKFEVNEQDMAEVYLKMESFNPGGSTKDRAALYMIEEAEKKGQLNPGDTIIEATSGNTGVALSMIGAVKGYSVVIVMPDTMSMERRSLMAAYGAELVLTDGKMGMSGSISKARELVDEKGYYMPGQFVNKSNVKAHYETTANEIWVDMNRKLDVFVAGVGTGGTITGTGKRLKELDPKIKIFAVQPAKSPVLTGGPPAGHRIQGMGANFIPDIYDGNVVDGIIDMTDDRAMEGTIVLAQKNGILAGISSGANLAAAIQIAKEIGPGNRVVTVLPDTGERYLSTDVFRKV